MKKVKNSLLTAILISFIFILPAFAEDAKQPPLEQVLPKKIATDQGEKKTSAFPIIINGDAVEYSTELNQVSATGDVEIIYKNTKLTCKKIVVNTQTKEGQAEGNVRIEDKKGVILGEKAIYNFQDKTGIIYDAEFRSNPYFGRSEKVKKVSEDEFISMRGYATTCSFNKPHYRMRSRKVTMFPGDKVQTRDDTLYIGSLPLAYIPQYNRSLKDPLMHVQLTPGKSKEWGMYVLSAWRMNLNQYINGRIYADYRQKIGIAEGFGTDYTTPGFGKGDFKLYYSHEKPTNLPQGAPDSFERYLIRLRHQWRIDDMTDFTMEYYKITDSKRAVLGSQYNPYGGKWNMLKDYFPREYEKDEFPLTYFLLHHNYSFSSVDILMQPRVNRWYTTSVEKLPEIKYTLPSRQIGESPFYFEDLSSYLNYNQKVGTSETIHDSNSDITYNQYDTLNKFSLPTKVAFFKLTPFASAQETLVDRTYVNSDPQGGKLTNVFSVGSDVTTKFYRLFDIKSNLLGLDLNGLRHIITPTAKYTYSSTSNMKPSKAQFGGGHTTGTSSVTMELENKLQTKRNNVSLDLAYFKVNTVYNLKSTGATKSPGSFSDVLFDLELRPYTWLSLDADATYQHSDQTSPNFNRFSVVDLDVNFNFGEDRTIGFGQRYLRKGSNEITQSINWRLNPKWKFSFYQRRDVGNHPTNQNAKGLLEQEYTITRDLHCWDISLTYNTKWGAGESLYLVFRLKAFPENEFGLNQTYHSPKKGSIENPQ